MMRRENFSGMDGHMKKDAHPRERITFAMRHLHPEYQTYLTTFSRRIQPQRNFLCGLKMVHLTGIQRRKTFSADVKQENYRSFLNSIEKEWSETYSEETH